MRARALICLIVLPAVTLATACGSESKSKAASTTRATTLAMPVGTVVVRAYFLRDGKLAVTGRTTVHTLRVSNAELGALFAGPNAAERRIGFGTTIPAGIEQKRIVLHGETLTVELTKNLNRVAQAQVVTTLTGFPTVQRVVLVTPAGTSSALAGAAFENLLPAVLIEIPLPFAQVRSPLRVIGSSNTFEATSQLELLDKNGKLLAKKTVTATSGTGTRGAFDVTLRFKAPAGPATLVSYENSAKDGSRIDVVRIPLQISGQAQKAFAKTTAVLKRLRQPNVLRSMLPEGIRMEHFGADAISEARSDEIGQVGWVWAELNGDNAQTDMRVFRSVAQAKHFLDYPRWSQADKAIRSSKLAKAADSYLCNTYGECMALVGAIVIDADSALKATAVSRFVRSVTSDLVWRRTAPPPPPGADWGMGGFHYSNADIKCAYWSDNDWQNLRCDNYFGLRPPPPPQNCEGDWGISVEMDRAGESRYHCVSDAIPPGRKLMPGQVWRRGDFSCSADSVGVNCRNGSGHGFYLSRRHSNLF